MTAGETQQNLKFYLETFWSDGWIRPTVPQSASNYSGKMVYLQRISHRCNIVR